MPQKQRTDTERLADLIQQLGAEPKETKFDDEGHLIALNLEDMQLSELPSEIWRFVHLQQLTLGRDFVQEGRLIRSGNQLSRIPSEISHLRNLQELDLRNNQLRSVPPELGQLSSLQALYLHDNQLRSVPPELGQLSRLQALLLDSNQLRTPPPEILARGTEDVLDFLRELQKGCVDRYEAKLLLVGEGATGKSCLRDSLLGRDFEKEKTTTHGIEIEACRFPHPDTPDKSATLHIWDFGGQQIYHTTHQFFMTKRSLYLLVWNARGDTDQARLDHWLRNIQVLAPEAAVLLVATHIDERPEDFNYDRFKAAYPQLAGHIGISNKTGEQIETLKEMIACEAAKLPLMEQQWPTTWVDAEEALHQTNKYHIDSEEFTTICEQQGVSAAIARSVLGDYLHDLGKILYFQDDDTLSNFVVLRPNWLTQTISRVLDDEPVRRQKGILDHTELSRIWEQDDQGRPYERRLYPCFLKLMERFLISYEIERDSRHQETSQSLVPLRLPQRPPEDLPAWKDVLPGQPEINMRFHLINFVPPGMMSWFIVLTHFYSTGVHWREGVRLLYEGHEAHVELNPSTHELWLRVKGAAPSNFFTILQHTINDRILEYYFEGLVYKREIPCNCHIKRNEAEPCPYFHDYERLAERMNHGKLTAECDVKPFEDVSVPELLEGIHHSTEDRVVAKLKETDEALQQLAQGQKTIIEITSENQELLQQNAQMFEQLNRSFARLWNLQMQSLQAECPNIFVLMPGSRSRFNPKNLFSEEFTLYLLCQHPVRPHIVKGDKGYPAPQAKKWWAEVAPWLKRITEYLRYIPKSKTLIEAYDEYFYKEIETSLEIFESVLDLTPAFEADERGKLVSGRGLYQDAEVEGPALRGLFHFLDEVDKKRHWCGLHRTVTNDGNIFWLCKEHRKLYISSP